MPTPRQSVHVLLLAALFGLASCGSETPEKMRNSARDYQAKNDHPAAIIQLKNVLQREPNSGLTRLMLGQSLLATGDAVSAALEFGKALELGQPDAVAIPLLAKSMLEAGQFQALVDQYGATDLEVPAAVAELKTSVATAYLALKNRSMAAAALADAQRAAPNSPPVLLMQARLATEERRLEDATALVEKAIAVAPNDAVAWHYKGEVLLLGAGDAKGAAAAYMKSLALNPGYLPARSNLLTTLIAQGDLKGASEQLVELKKFAPGAVQTLFFEAKLASLNKDMKKAHELTQQLVKLAPENVQVLSLAGSVAMGEGSLLEADRHLSKALLLAPRSVSLRYQLARVYLRSGKPQRAIDTVAPLNGAAPRARTHALLGEAFVQLGKPAEAEANFAKAARLNPADRNSRAGLALARLQGGGDAEAAVEQLDAVAAESTDASAELALVVVHLKRKEFDQALAAITRVESKQPKRPLTAYLLGRIHFAQGKTDLARREFERTLALDPVFIPAVFALATLDASDSQFVAAQKRFEAVLAVDEDNLEALMGLALSRERAGAKRDEVAKLFGNAIRLRPSAPAPRLAVIERHFQSGDFKSALAAAQQADSAIPNDADVVDTLGRAQAAAGEANQALTSFNRLAALTPDSPKAALRAAGVQLAMKNLPAAEQSFRRALMLAPTLVVAQQGLIQTLLDAKRPKDALVVAKRVQQQRPKESVGYMLEGNIERSLGNLPTAEAAYRKAFNTVPTTAGASAIYSVLASAGKKGEAEKFAGKWLDAHPTDAEFIGFMGESAMARGQFEMAEGYFTRLIEKNPRNALVLNNLSWLKLQLKRPGALADAEQANALVPDAPPYLDTLAQALAAENKVDKALEVQKKALALAPSQPLLRLTLAKLYVQAGDKKSARTELEILAKHGMSFDGHAEVDRMLKAL